MRAYRIFESKHSETAFTGEGARRYGGRWNSPGIPVVYVATSFALALLEVMANARAGRVPPDMVYCAIDIPEDLRLETLDLAALPVTWHTYPAPPELQAAGDEWFSRSETVGLVVPSAIARIETNVILNPAHPDFARITIGEPKAIPVDSRLMVPVRRKKH